MPRLIITAPDANPQPYRFDLERAEVTLGRGPENDIPIDCGSVSVHHAVMQRVVGGYQLRDLASTNGTKFNSIRMDIIPLSDGMVAHLGDVSFDFTLTDDERATLLTELQADHAVDEEDVEIPIRKASKKRPAPVINPIPTYMQTPRRGMDLSVGTLFSFLVCALVAFYIGAHIRHQKDTNSNLLKSIVNKSNVSAPAAAPAPAVEPSPAAEPAK